LSDLRDKKILELDEDEVARVEVRGRGESRFAASRDSTGAWSLEGAADREVKTWRFNSLINDLNALEVNRFVEDDVEPSSLSAYGMAPPRMSFHIDRVDGEAVELVVGAATEDGHVYVMRADVASVARVEADIVNNLDLSLDDVSTVIEEAAAEAAETGG
jgi:hypothetical protein